MTTIPTTPPGGDITPVSIEGEMRTSYLDYAMSVIVSRALPDVRDGLKPVHRRILYSMKESGYDYNRPFRKAARIVGEVMGKYHPHGDSAIYDAMVRMAQDFSLRLPLIAGQGNFGSMDGDRAAAMRYTEARLARAAHALLEDIDKDTVDFRPNYDESESEPSVLPAQFPNLLVNGAGGIAVGMATNIPPHNLGEVIDACCALIDDPDITVDTLIENHIQGPDFPTGAIILGKQGIRLAYHTGRGAVIVRGRTTIEEIRKDREAIIISEIPYQVNKARMVETLAEAVRDKKIEGVAELRDESDRDGVRVVVEIKRDAVPDVVLNQLYRYTPLQTSFGINMLALRGGQPQTMNLKEIIAAFVAFREEVIRRRTVFELGKARDRAHVLAGLAVAVANIDEVIKIIRAARDPATARARLMEQPWPVADLAPMIALLDEPGRGVEDGRYRLSEIQAKAILELRLQRLTGLEQDKIIGEYREVMAQIADLLDILARPERITAIIVEELTAIRAEFGDERRSQIEHNATELDTEDLITPQDLVVTLSHSGYMKSQPISEYRAQKRGGRGKQAAATKEDDWIDTLFVANTHDYILCFSNRGRLYWLKVWEVPQGSRNSRGRPIVNMFPLSPGEKINVILPVKQFDEQHFVFMSTSKGTVKKTALTEFSNPRKAGIIAVDLDEGDFLIGADITDGQHDVMLFSDAGKAVRFDENDVRPMGRQARGVRGMNLEDGQQVIAMLVAPAETAGEGEQAVAGSVLTATENGYGKRTPISEYTRHGRGTKGMIAIQTSERNGRVVAAALVAPEDEIMLITTGGVLIRTRVDEIREMGRATQGVTLIAVGEGNKLSGLQRVVESDAEGDDGADAADAAPDADAQTDDSAES